MSRKTNLRLMILIFFLPRKGDKVIMEYIGLLSNGTQFDSGQSEFVIGENNVIPGLEQGMEGGCAGEKINIIVPPEFGYGDSPSDKVNYNYPILRRLK